MIKKSKGEGLCRYLRSERRIAWFQKDATPTQTHHAHACVDGGGGGIHPKKKCTPTHKSVEGRMVPTAGRTHTQDRSRRRHQFNSFGLRVAVKMCESGVRAFPFSVRASTRVSPSL